MSTETNTAPASAGTFRPLAVPIHVPSEFEQFPYTTCLNQLTRYLYGPREWERQFEDEYDPENDKATILRVLEILENSGWNKWRIGECDGTFDDGDGSVVPMTHPCFETRADGCPLARKAHEQLSALTKEFLAADAEHAAGTFPEELANQFRAIVGEAVFAAEKAEHDSLSDEPSGLL